MLRRRILSWYRRSGRDLPWRRTRDPYRVLVSEVMLQQTQVSRVLPAYRRFLRRFPTLPALSRAALGEVLREWSGLGYNRRARDLHRIARSASSLPRTVAGLDALPGVGAYTASAVACFAFDKATGFADTNIRRVLGRAILRRLATDREGVELDARFGSKREPARWHHALMDIGATICLAKRPRCDACPIRAICGYDGVEEPPPRRQSPFAASDRRVRGAIVRHLAAVHALLAILEQPTPEMQQLRSLLTTDGRCSSRRTRVPACWCRRLAAIPATLPAQIGCLGRHLVELVRPWEHTGRAAALDSPIVRARSSVWHKKDREVGIVPHASVDTDAHCTKSGWHGWVYGWLRHEVAFVAVGPPGEGPTRCSVTGTLPRPAVGAI